MLTLFGIMGLVFLILSPTILLPGTWHEMGIFAGNKRIGHDGYEFMNRLYSHHLDDWLKGIPASFYVIFTWVKLPVLVVAGFLVGLPLLFRRKLGDGRYFVLLWLYFWFASFSFVGGKFTRYYTTALPPVLITSAIGIQFLGRWLAEKFSTIAHNESIKHYIPATLAVVVIIASVITSVQAGPHFRLYTNVLGGGMSQAGYYFPHDEFYDASMRELMDEIARRAAPGARVASESPLLASYYAQRNKRPDLVCLSLSDAGALQQLTIGDFLIAARGRRYFSNDALISMLSSSATPDYKAYLGNTPSADLFVVNDHILSIIRPAAQQMQSLPKQTR